MWKSSYLPTITRLNTSIIGVNSDDRKGEIQLSASAINIIKTIAGTGMIGYNGDNILATKAYLTYNRMVAVDTSGDIYIADAENHRIRLVTKMTGIITTIAGTGVPGYNGENIAATSALLNLPSGIAIDLTGDIYITDQLNHRLRILSKKTGNITTVAGNGFATFYGDNIQSSLSILNVPSGIAIDASRNIYFADIFNHRVRMINIITGIITTVAGTGMNTFTGDDILATTTALNRPKNRFVLIQPEICSSQTPPITEFEWLTRRLAS